MTEKIFVEWKQLEEIIKIYKAIMKKIAESFEKIDQRFKVLEGR